MSEWWDGGGRGGQAFSWTAFAPQWPDNGEIGDVLYVTAYAGRGWQILRRTPSGRAQIESATYAEALRALPPDLHAKAADAQLGIEEAAQTNAQKWLDRRARYRMERMEVVVGA